MEQLIRQEMQVLPAIDAQFEITRRVSLSRINCSNLAVSL